MNKLTNPRFMLITPMTLWQVVGGVLILGFTLWNEISPKEKIKSVFSKALNINCFAEYALFYFFFLLLIR